MNHFTLVKNNIIISDVQKFSLSISILYYQNLGLVILKNVISATNGIEEPGLRACHKYQRHPSIIAIKEKYKDLNFSFSRVNLPILHNDNLRSLDFSKSVHENDIPTGTSIGKNMDILLIFL